MSKFDITTSIFYRWRFVIGYAIIFILLIGLLFLSGFIIPSGISRGAQNTLITTSQLSLGELWHQTPTSAPYHLLQYATISLFGVSVLGIKLPSLLLGLATAVCMVFLLRRWFSPGIAVLASVLAVTTGQFLFVAGQGSTAILYLFWPTLLLLIATLAANRTKYRSTFKLLFFVVAALSLYTPLSIYVLIAMASAALLHPHLRHIIKRLSLWRLLVGTGAAAIILTPLVYSIVRDPGMGLTLLGIPSEWPNILDNLRELAGQYFGFTSLGGASVLLPIFSLASMLVIVYGLTRLIRTYATVQSHVVLAWIILLLPVLILNPAFISIVFVPLLLLLASGLEGILRHWYRLFPFNPYARVAGLIPLVVLVGSMVLFGLERYGYAYRYAPDIVRNFSQDVFIMPDTDRVVVAESEKALYEAVATLRDSDLTVTTEQPKEGQYIVTAAAYNDKRIPNSIVTTGRTDDAARFYIYR